MPWCPKCHCEYKEGITICADCNTPLVDELPTESEQIEYNISTIEEDNIVDSEQFEEETADKNVLPYRNKKEIADDFRSSAYTLLIVGTIGLMSLVLIEMQVLPIRLAAPGKYITYGVMGLMFITFIVFGVKSNESAKKYSLEAIAEEELIRKIREWYKNKLTREIIEDASQSMKDTPEEMSYYVYYSKIKEMITDEFGKQDASFLDFVAEEIYSNLFEKK